MNEEGESGKPYDLVSDRDDGRVYIEVKSTVDGWIRLSPKEVGKILEQKGSNYHLIVVTSGEECVSRFTSPLTELDVFLKIRGKDAS